MQVIRSCVSVCFIVLIFSSLAVVNAQVIKPLGSGLTMRGTVYDIAVDSLNDISYYVGDLSAVDGVKMEKVAVRENDVWKAIQDTSKIDGVILCALVHEGELYIGGKFTIASNTVIRDLAKLSNGVWQTMGVESLSGAIRDISWFEDALYVTGDFKNINGVRSNGLMKNVDGKWLDSGLDSPLNAKGLFVSENTLYAWGNGITASNNENSHSVSYLNNQEWTTLPYISTIQSETCVMFEDVLYITKGNQLIYFDFSNHQWNLVATGEVSSTATLLFEHMGELYVVFDNSKFYRLSNGNLELMEFQNSNNYFFENVYVVVGRNGKLIVGGDFRHWTTETASLALIDGSEISSFGKVSSKISHKSAWLYSVGRSIVKYNDKYLIGGTFDFADDIYTPNLVYWNNGALEKFEVPLPDGIKQLEVFENELYALPHSNTWTDPLLSGFKLIKFDGAQWSGVEVPLNLDKIRVVNDKLFISDDYYYSSTDGGPYYLQGGEWLELEPVPNDGLGFWYNYGGVESYYEGYLLNVESWPNNLLFYRENDDSEWVVLDTVNVRFDFVETFDDRVFLIDEWPRHIFELVDGVVDTIAVDLETDNFYFFKVNDQIFYSAWNESTYRLRDGGLELYNSIRVCDVEKISDNEYLCALQSQSYSGGLETIELNKIGILTFEDLEVELMNSEEEVCNEEYVEYWPFTDHINVQLAWEFEGGVPSRSNDLHPMVKYNIPGTYLTTLRSNNLDGDTIYQTSEVIIDECDLAEERNNNYDNHWIMGYEYSKGHGLGGFDFTIHDTVMSPRYFPPEDLSSGSITMSDENGDLQFYSNGISIRNMENKLIAGSDCFNAELDDYPLDYFLPNQSLMCIPDVSVEGIYQVFDIDPLSIEGEYWVAGSNLSMTTIDMNRNDGKGEVIDCNIEIIDDDLLTSTMQATRHSNGVDWWIIVGKYNSDQYYKLLFTANGIVSIELSSWDRNYEGVFSGQSTFSPDGNYFAQVVREDQEVVIWKFDNTTGELYDQVVYNIVPTDELEYPQGCSFSPNSRFLYVSSRTQLRQLDLCSYNEVEIELIDSWNGTVEFYPLLFGKQMLAPNQQIIVTPTGNGHRSFGVIQSPNEKGKDCDFIQQALRIPSLTRNQGDVIPFFPHYRNYPSYEWACGDTSIDSTTSEEFSVYPNPIMDVQSLHLSIKTSGTLYDIGGSKIYSFSNADYLDLNSLSAGVYMLETEFGTQKIIKL